MLGAWGAHEPGGVSNIGFGESSCVEDGLRGWFGNSPTSPKCPRSVPESVPGNGGYPRECPTGCLRPFGPRAPECPKSVPRVSLECQKGVPDTPGTLSAPEPGARRAPQTPRRTLLGHPPFSGNREKKKAHKHKHFALVNVQMALGQTAGCPRVNRTKKFMCSPQNTGNVNLSLWLTGGLSRLSKSLCVQSLCAFFLPYRRRPDRWLQHSRMKTSVKHVAKCPAPLEPHSEGKARDLWKRTSIGPKHVTGQ